MSGHNTLSGRGPSNNIGTRPNPQPLKIVDRKTRAAQLSAKALDLPCLTH